MDSNCLKNRIDEIALNHDLDVEERIKKILDLGQQALQEVTSANFVENHQEATSIHFEENQDVDDTERYDNESEDEIAALRAKQEEILFTSLIEMIKQEENPGEYIAELLDLYASLASVYADLQNFRAIKPLADDVLDILRHDEADWKIIKEPVGEMIDLLGQTIFLHPLLEMLILYIKTAAKEGQLGIDLKGRVRKMLKLHLLLPDGCWCSYMIRKDLSLKIAKLMNSDELLKIIISPELESLKRDPVEYTKEWEDIYYDVEDELNRRFEGAPRYHGFCYSYWRAKRELLKEKYDIDWRSPSQMNPRVKFD